MLFCNSVFIKKKLRWARSTFVSHAYQDDYCFALWNVCGIIGMLQFVFIIEFIPCKASSSKENWRCDFIC